MLNMNRATLLGHAGRDPELRDLKGGGQGGGVHAGPPPRNGPDREGRPAEATEWHRVVVYGSAVEAVGSMLKKGGAVLVEGRIATRGFTDREGNDRTVTEIVVAGRAGHGQHPVRAAARSGSVRAGAGSGGRGRGDGGCRDRRRRGYGGGRMTRRIVPLAALALLAILWSGAGLGAVLHRALRQPDLGRVLGVPLSHHDRPDPDRQRVGGAGHAQPVLADLPLRLAHSAHRALARGVGAGTADGRDPAPPGASPTWAGSASTRGCTPQGAATGSSGGDGAKGSVWHAHYYMYPLLSWIGVLLDLGCLEGGGLDIAWTSELDPAWLDDELSFLLNPEAALFANLPAQAACAADCAAASAGLPLDPMFWCAGCQGGMYPLTGNVAAHVGGVQASLLAAQRLVYRLHRAGIAWGTSGSAALCARYPMPVMRKSQYRWQMTEPVPATSPMTGCNPTGRSSVLWESLRELPVAGENFGYLLWRKRTCCML